MSRLIVLALFALFSVPAFAGISQSNLNRQIDQTNFLVNDNCSGTLIDAKEGLILTANHCIADQFQDVERDQVDPKTGEVKKVKVRVTKPGSVSQLTFSGAGEVERTVFVYKIKAHDPDHDLGLVQVIAKLPSRRAVPIACREPQRLDAVYAVGNPRVVMYSSVSTGIIASVQRNYRLFGIDGDAGDGVEQPGDNALIQHTAPIAGGNSGGALLNDDGAIIGVNVRGYQAMAPLGLAVPLDDIRAFLKDNAPDTVPQCGEAH